MDHEEHLQRMSGVYDPDWTQEEIEHELVRLRGLLRIPTLTSEERAIVKDTLAFWEDVNGY
ncbi:hypothetical protein KGP36_03470 [Patescibacteria group bacterium]|nr:hypothetical protein [Patescibacteria group bacterium]